MISSQASTQSSLVCLVASLLIEVGKDAKTEFIFQYFDIPPNLSSQVLDQTFLIVQEAANNIVKHAHANHAFIQLYCRDSELIVSIEDDGVGFDYLKEKGKGFAFWNIGWPVCRVPLNLAPTRVVAQAL